MPRLRHSWSYLGATLFLCFLLADCVKGQCQVPPSKTGLELTEESAALDTFDEGSSVTFKCGAGYTKVSGDGTIFCRNGIWTVETLQCQKKSCGSPGDLINGRFSTPEGTDFGATAYASCNRGYEMHGTAYRQCYDFGWNNRVPRCEIKKCDDPPTIVNGIISSRPDTEFPVFRDIVQYKCDKNYNIVGDSQLVCNEFGSYNGTVPQCKELNCPTPSIKNAQRVEGGPPPYKLKYFVTYRCNDGYVMEGQSKLVCEATGWSSDFPTCNKALPPPVPTKTAEETTTRTLPKPGPESTVLPPVPPVSTVPPKTARTTTRRTGLPTEPSKPAPISCPDPKPVVIAVFATLGALAVVGIIAAFLFKSYKKKRSGAFSTAVYFNRNDVYSTGIYFNSEYLTGEDTRKPEGEMPLSPKAHTQSYP
ncbi:complement factor H-like isoform X6 [Anguilla rostrata]|uniref:complement factor H-like isoform X6 n=1 Tax=Anguilla rostrata TaxID=7938 RepID=UPI0030CF8575